LHLFGNPDDRWNLRRAPCVYDLRGLAPQAD
jgi:hypothetical protein